MLSLSLILHYKYEGKIMKEELYISEKKIVKLAQKVAKTICLSREEALEFIQQLSLSVAVDSSTIVLPTKDAVFFTDPYRM